MDIAAENYVSRMFMYGKLRLPFGMAKLLTKQEMLLSYVEKPKGNQEKLLRFIQAPRNIRL